MQFQKLAENEIHGGVGKLVYDTNIPVILKRNLVGLCVDDNC